MELRIGYNELSAYISDIANKKIEISYVNPETIKVSVGFDMIIKEMKASLKMTVKKITNAYILIGYEGAWGMDKIVSLIIKILGKINPGLGEYTKAMSDNRLLIGLINIDQLKQLLETVTLDFVEFTESGVSVLAHFSSAQTYTPEEAETTKDPIPPTEHDILSV